MKTALIIAPLLLAALKAGAGEAPLVTETGPVITLDDAHRMAIRHHPGYRNVNESIEQADALICSAWSMLLPTLRAGASVIRNENEVSMAFPQFDSTTGAVVGMDDMIIQEKWQVGFNLTAGMTLFNARSIPAIRIAYDLQEQTRLDAMIARNDLLFAVTSAWYQIAGLRELIGVNAQNVDVAVEFDRLAQARQAAGQATKIDAMRARMQLMDARRQLDDAKDAYETARNALAILLGHKGDWRFETPSTAPVIPAETVAALTKQALSRRVDLQSADIDVRMARRDKTETLARLVPVFDVTWQWNASTAEGFSGDNTNWTLIFGANWSILEGGARLAEMKMEASRIRVAQNRREQLEMDIRTNVDRQYRDIVGRRRHLEVSGERLALAQENHRMVSSQYQVGLATSLDLVDASTELSRSRLQLAMDQLALDMAILTLRRSIGEYSSLALK